ncbi:phosphate ABC transporter substrate-binding protein, PhoT family (TC 3.A.1.7.1) [Caloranaerobacter azorensis DSM 13643]|uniref:Phosphate-binding protein n=1 Tax=Caloranaerobacter azorensis DSM 13643 TaxID=1121264 RepID=A0A1M5V6W7_9FIRM|nr:PstS family phosphate ABC transporter substrate-binding protein [Caloranaerobacter azorensis]SHH70673.1 phosphate ABC transporter substrate-binding protein, PhoT family (TC 3.A.1.7.1) [Caloranaerobacter azorensis DSM 13643]
MLSKKARKFISLTLSLAIVIFMFVGCSSQTQKQTDNNQGKVNAGKLSGKIEVDGSSTVFPITEAMAEEFQKMHKDVKITVGVSGTGGGFKRFTKGETDISDASRPIKDKEAKIAQENGIKYKQIKIAYDGISVLVNPQNDWVDNLTVEELKKIWEPNSKVKTWKDIRPEWPDKEIKLYGPGTDSGTFDYFTEEIIGESGKIRTDFTASEDDNVLVQGIAGDKYALGYFGYAYYVENKDVLKIVPINGVKPTTETIEKGEYTPLSRPLFIYVSQDSFNNKEQVREFVKFYLKNARDIVPETGYVPLKQEVYDKQLEELLSGK